MITHIFMYRTHVLTIVTGQWAELSHYSVECCKREDLCLIPSSHGKSWIWLAILSLGRQSPVDPWSSLPRQPSIAGKL